MVIPHCLYVHLENTYQSEKEKSNRAEVCVCVCEVFTYIDAIQLLNALISTYTFILEVAIVIVDASPARSNGYSNCSLNVMGSLRTVGIHLS